MSVDRHSLDFLSTDILIIGSEGAGCLAAIGASDKDTRITIVTKGRWGKSGATVTGFADFAVDSRSLKSDFGFKDASNEDSQDLFLEDTLKGGKYLNNQKLVKVLVEKAPQRLRMLREWGANLNEVISASGHQYPRGVAFPGPGFVQVIKRRTLAVPNLSVMENTVALEIIVDRNAVKGALALNMETGAFCFVQAKAVILATGGGMSTFKHSTAPVELTGDGMAMAARAGASLVDMEFPMFFPGLFAWPSALKKIEVPYHLSAAGIIHGHMYNSRGERFMKKWDPEHMEHTTRDIVSVGMYSEILAGNTGKHGGVYVSIKHLPDDLIEHLIEWDPLRSLKRYGFGKAYFDMSRYLPDLKRTGLEAVPASHFFNGGVRIDESGQTEVAGLFAAGEVTGGVHGANRLSGNAFSDFMVFGQVAGESAREFAKHADTDVVPKALVEQSCQPYFTLLDRKTGLNAFKTKARFQNLAWEKLGVVRTKDRIREALEDIKRARAEIESSLAVSTDGLIMNRELLTAIEARNIAQNIELIAVAALNRPESRGAHYLAENPVTDYSEWTKNIRLKVSHGEIVANIEPIVGGIVEPPHGKVPYGQTEAE